ncbi:hypothetical protein BD413DRAFT_492851 [Trametes elegans]|nr:hypothetical protein BD413DRAFT_492851 [Trametes elegans]
MFQTGADVVVCMQFINHGVLLNSQDTNFRGVLDNWPVFALAHDLGNVNAASTPMVFSIGHARDPAIKYIAANNVQQQRSSVFWAHYLDFNTVISTFLGDYSNALTRANAFDTRVSEDATQVSSDYAVLVALLIRQAFGATELMVQKLGPGSYDTSDIMMFIKEISSDGVTGQYPNAWAAHDVGMSFSCTHYPITLGHNDECGNMLIMALSYTQRTNDTALIHTYYNLLDGWAQFLVQNMLSPPDQHSADSALGSLANQTNLAIKGIIGIRAMSEIADIVGDNAKSSNYNSIASTYAQEWQTLATSADGTHLTLTYGNDSSWGLTYNLYADKLLGTNIVPELLYSLLSSRRAWDINSETKWYSAHTNSYGVPLDSRQTLSKSDWQIWAAAFVTDNTVRDSLIGAVRKYAANGQSTQPFPDAYDTLQARFVVELFYRTRRPLAARFVVKQHHQFRGRYTDLISGVKPIPAGESECGTLYSWEENVVYEYFWRGGGSFGGSLSVQLKRATIRFG